MVDSSLVEDSSRYRLRYFGQERTLPQGDFVIGRGVECHLSLSDELVSRQHARIEVAGSGAFIEDLGSRNGVLVNGVRIFERTPLADGDRVVIGRSELLFVEIGRRRRDDMVTGPIDITGLLSRLPPPTSIPPASNTGIHSVYDVLLNACERHLARRENVEAEKAMGRLFLSVRAALLRSVPPDELTLRRLAEVALTLTERTGDPQWTHRFLDTAGAALFVIEDSTIERIGNLLAVGVSLGDALDAYVAKLRPTASDGERLLRLARIFEVRHRSVP